MGLFGSVGGLLDMVFKKGSVVPKPQGGKKPPKAALKKALIPVKKLMLRYKKNLKK